MGQALILMSSDESDEFPSPPSDSEVGVLTRQRASRRLSLETATVSSSSSESSSIESLSSDEESRGATLIANSGSSREEEGESDSEESEESNDSSVERMRIVSSIFPEQSSSDSESEPETDMAPTTRSLASRGRLVNQPSTSAATPPAPPSRTIGGGRSRANVRGHQLGQGRGRGRGRGRRASSASTITVSAPQLPSEHERRQAGELLANLRQLQDSWTSNRTAQVQVPAQDFGVAVSAGNFECVVCLETLDCPATILPVEAPSTTRHVLNIPGAPPLLINAAVAIVGSSGTHQTASAARAARELAAIDPRELCVTSCGHMYHKYCVQKWFNEQGRKSCPNCRKIVSKGMIKLYPNFSQDAGDGRGSRQSFGSVAATAGSGARAAPNSNCQNRACMDLSQIHQTLINDYNDLRERNERAMDDLEMRNGELASLQDSHDRAQEELEKLRGEPAEKRLRRN